jgi:uncharacterized membrane protein
MPGSVPAHRHHRLDALRTLAMVWMTVFHFCFDLNHLGLMPPQQFLLDPFWTWQRTAIVSLFLFTAGLSQAVALHSQGLLQRPVAQRFDARFWRRWGQVAGCALLVSAGSAVMFPHSYIYFGVLHGLAVMLLLARLCAGWGRALWGLGVGVIALKFIAAYALNESAGLDFFNEKPLNGLGLISRKPFTEDYVPLVPWLAAVWWGLAAGLWVLRKRPHWLQPLAPGAWERRWMPRLAAPGRWSLSYYLLHQPVLIGTLMLWTTWTR